MNILVPIDFSPFSIEALMLALKIRKQTNSNIIALTVIEEPDHVSKWEVQDQMNNVHASYNGMRDYIDGIENLKVKVVVGNLIDELHNCELEHNIDLILMGTHGVNGLREWVVGTNTLKAMRKVSCPMIGVKECAKNFSFDKILFVSDFNAQDKSGFERLSEFATPFNSSIHLLNVDTPAYFTEIPFVIRECMDEFAELYEGETHIHRVDALNVQGGVQKAIIEIKPDLIVVPLKSKYLLKRYFFYGLAENILQDNTIPVMTINQL